MATTLPAIKQPASKPLRGIQQHTLPDKTKNKSKETAAPAPVVVVRRVMNKKELDLEQRRLAARAKLPQLTEWQTDE